MNRVHRILRKLQERASPPDQEFNQKIEAAFYLETILRTCLQAMADTVNNGQIRMECQLFFKEAALCQNQMELYFRRTGINLERIQRLCRDHGIDPAGLSIVGLIETALLVCARKAAIYRYLARFSTGPSHTLFAKAYLRTYREIQFLKKEEAFHRSRGGPVAIWYWNF